MTKVVHLTSVHKADDVRIFHKECRSLAKAGYDVVLIARADEDYERDGVQIRAVRGGTGNRLARMTRTVWQVYRMALAENGDIYHFHDPELIPVGIAFKLRGKRVIYDAHEDFHAQLQSKSWIPSQIRKPVASVVGRLERWAAKVLDLVVVANPMQAKRFSPSTTRVVQNFPMRSEFFGLAPGNYQARDPIALYVGGLEEIRGVREMVEAIEIVNRSVEATLVLGGNFQSRMLYDEVTKMPGWKFVRYVGYMSRRELICQLENARVGLVVVHPTPNYLSNQPVKLFEYMMAGLPVVASNFPNYKPFVEDMGTGVLVDPLSPASVADGMVRCLKNPVSAEVMGEKGKSAVIERLNWESEVPVLLQSYRELVAEDVKRA